ncbi:MAG: hypothetical protein HY343_07165 [Lentisphaerae bacterium]|nr:hypothetical protein [Lentisphaerota bacterium]
MAEHSEATSFLVEKKLHSGYFENYFRALQAKTIIVETAYIDRDFLEDFSAYYVRCFHEYKKTCARFHFFNRQIDNPAFEGVLDGCSNALTTPELQASYLGFVVVKPLPETIIGRTCLRTYDRDKGRRDFPITRQYEANLFGIPLTVDTLAFQEQDRVAAACATSALWSVFHGTGKLFQHHIPSPVEITQAATEHWVSETRVLPNCGLTPEQMAYAIRKVGLEPLLVSAKNEFLLQATVYAYSRGHVPVLMGVTLRDMSDMQGAEPRDLGKHAVAVTGYSLGKPAPKPYASTGFLLQASRIDKLYAHDDQVGPFARMELGPGYLTTSWKGRKDGKSGSVRAVPTLLIIPLYHKIRIPFDSVLQTVIAFDAIVEGLRPKLTGVFPDRLRWDIGLTTVNEFKSDLLSAQPVKTNQRRAVLGRPLPHYIWKASASTTQGPALDLVFDATDIEQGHFLSLVVEYNSTLAAVLRSLSREKTVIENLSGRSEWRILEWFSK